ncbi:LysR family transcriptional regulator [Comamonas sp. 17RB]|uniref:LysR family transcriptional regulator n=1 Tax=Comamonas sp. 17RB TaxID=3047025 RepID=UPI0024B80DCC|nr:LysR family transcriptional regulator [Comamonas sp. 17RB]MDI9854305.1 LysR family transcriptional regulator [Comamonas sp. 17RB]
MGKTDTGAGIGPATANSRVLQEAAVRYFLEVVRTGSIKEAATRLNVAPSAVSRQIARLESDLDTLLFERRSRGMVPNSAGELLAAHARRVEQDIERVTSEIQSLRGMRTGQVRIASVEGFAHDFIPMLIAQFQRRYEGVAFRLDVCSQGDVARRVRDGEVDIGITLSSVPEPDIRVELRHPCPIMAVLGEKHPLASRPQLSLREVTAYPLVLPLKSSTLRQLLDISCSRQGLRYRQVLVSNHADALVSYAAASELGVAFYGELSVRTRRGGNAVRAVPLRDREMNERYLEVQTLAGRNLQEAVHAFVQYLVAAIRADGNGGGGDADDVDNAGDGRLPGA